MPNLNKYSTTRQFISMSFNKYNLYNLISLKKNIFSKKKNKRITIYKRQLTAKQRLRRYYGNIKENQFYSLYKKASLYKGSPSSNLFILLERRLDVILFRSNLVSSIYTSRQLISHGHVLVNNNKVTVSSYLVQDGDLIQINKNSIKFVKTLITNKLNISNKIKDLLKNLMVVPAYLEVNYNTLTIMLIKSPTVNKIPYPINFSKILIDKFYSKA
jgi:small subunit ribosomal protein S4